MQYAFFHKASKTFKSVEGYEKLFQKVLSIDAVSKFKDNVFIFDEHFSYPINPRVCLSILRQTPVWSVSENIYVMQDALDSYVVKHNQTEAEQQTAYMCKIALEYLFDVQTMLIVVSNHIYRDLNMYVTFDADTPIYKFDRCPYFFNLYSTISLSTFKHNSLPQYVIFSVLPLVESMSGTCFPFPLNYVVTSVNDYTLLRQFALQNMKINDENIMYTTLEQHCIQDIVNYVAHVSKDKSKEMQTYIRTMLADDFELFTKYYHHQFIAKFYLTIDDVYTKYHDVPLFISPFVQFMNAGMLAECIRFDNDEDMVFTSKFDSLFIKYRDFWMRCLHTTYDANTCSYIIPARYYNVFSKIFNESRGFTHGYYVN